MRNMMRNCMDDDTLLDMPNPKPSTWLATTSTIVKPLRASSHSKRGFFTFIGTVSSINVVVS